MNTHIHHTDMKNVGCRAICNFIDWQNRSTIVIHGGVKILINTINIHSTHKDIQIQEYALEETLYQVWIKPSTMGSHLYLICKLTCIFKIAKYACNRENNRNIPFLYTNLYKYQSLAEKKDLREINQIYPV